MTPASMIEDPSVVCEHFQSHFFFPRLWDSPDLGADQTELILG